MRDTSRNPFQENIGQETAFLSAAALIVPTFGFWQFSNVYMPRTYPEPKLYFNNNFLRFNWVTFLKLTTFLNTEILIQPDFLTTRVQRFKMTKREKYFERKIINAGWEGGERRLREIWAV